MVRDFGRIYRRLRHDQSRKKSACNAESDEITQRGFGKQLELVGSRVERDALKPLSDDSLEGFLKHLEQIEGSSLHAFVRPRHTPRQQRGSRPYASPRRDEEGGGGLGARRRAVRSRLRGGVEWKRKSKDGHRHRTGGDRWSRLLTLRCHAIELEC